MNLDSKLFLSLEDKKRLEHMLLQNLKTEQTNLQALLDRVNDDWCYEDGIYRFYHQSFKVFDLQNATAEIVDNLKKIAPERQGLCDFFNQIIAAGTNQKFQLDDNAHWVERAAPIVQAFLHARYFLEMLVKYSAELGEPPETLPSGWAAMLELYDIR